MEAPHVAADGNGSSGNGSNDDDNDKDAAAAEEGALRGRLRILGLLSKLQCRAAYTQAELNVTHSSDVHSCVLSHNGRVLLAV